MVVTKAGRGVIRTETLKRRHGGKQMAKSVGYIRLINAKNLKTFFCYAFIVDGLFLTSMLFGCSCRCCSYSIL